MIRRGTTLVKVFTSVRSTAGTRPPGGYFFAALIFAHRARCAAAILFLPAAEILRRGCALTVRVLATP